MVNVGGRPREHDRDQIAKDMLEWAQLKDSTNLCGFAGPRQLSPEKLRTFCQECDRFRSAYNSVKLIIGQRRENMLNAKLLDSHAYNRNAHTYDAFMRETYQSDKEYELTLRIRELEIQLKMKQEEAKTVPDDIRDTFTALMSQVSSRQSTSSKDLTNSNIDK